MRLFKSFSIYTISAFLTQAVNLLLIPVFTNYLTTEDYGILSLITTIMSFMAPFIVLGTDGAISIEYYKNTFKDLSTYITSSLTLSLLSCLIIFFLCFIFNDVMAKQFAIPGIYIICVPVLCFMDTVKNINLLFYQIKRESFSYAMYSLSNTFLNILMALVFIIVLHYNYEGRLYGQYVVGIAYFIAGLYILSKHKLIGIRVSKKMMTDAFHYGLPLVPHAIGFIVINLVDRLFISRYVGNDSLGIYSLAYTIGSVIILVAQAFNNAWVPSFLEILSQNTAEGRIKIVLITYMYTIALLVLTIGLIIIAPFLYQFFINKKFHDGLPLARFFTAVICHLLTTYFFSKKTKYLHTFLL